MGKKSGKPAAGSRPDPLGIARALVELAAQHQLAELEVEQGGTRVRVIREHAPSPAEPAGRVEGPATSHSTAQQAVEPPIPSTMLTIEAPMVGTFYRASSPEAAAFVSEGDVIKEGQVLCIIEAMKLMNEIEAKVSGRIVKVLVENTQPVEYGQPLFLVDPAR